MLFISAFQLLIALLVSAILVSLAARFARTTFRRRVDPGVVSQQWLLSHRAED